jgi:hypothetical protein
MDFDDMPTVKSRDQTLKGLKKRANDCGASFLFIPGEGEDRNRIFDDVVEIDLPNGDDRRSFTVEGTDIEVLQRARFEDLRVIGDYSAIVDLSCGTLEVGLASPMGLSGYIDPGRRIWRIPGTLLADWPEHADEESDARAGYPEPSDWSLVASKDERTLKVAPSSEIFSVLWAKSRGRVTTLTLEGFPELTDTAALGLLQGVVEDFLFDLDLGYGVSMNPRRARPPRRGSLTQVRRSEAPEYPRNRYARIPLELYRHGRSARGLPVLQYQYYYQVVEYFFPSFVQAETIRQVRTVLANPAFSEGRDEDLTTLIGIANSGDATRIRERDQMRSAVAASVTEFELRQWIVDLDERYDGHFSKRKQDLSGVEKVDLSSPLIAQVAKRVYDLRCRVVHAKSDGGANGDEQLLPSSDEVQYLGADVELVQRLAQRAIVAQATAA